MKRAVFILIVALAVIGVTTVMFKSTTLFKDGKSSYAIVLCNDASASEETAAKELQHYLKQIGGAELPIISSDRKSTRLNSSHLRAARMPSSA